MSGHSSSDFNDLQLLTLPYDSLGDGVIVADAVTTGIFNYAARGPHYAVRRNEYRGRHVQIRTPIRGVFEDFLSGEKYS